MSIILRNNELILNEKSLLLDLKIDEFINYLENNRFHKKYKNTGKNLSANQILNEYYSQLVVRLFWKHYLKNAKFPELIVILNEFLEISIDKRCYPIKNKEYVLLDKEQEEVKLNSLIYKFYKTYSMLCVYLYHHIKFLEIKDVVSETNLINILNLTINDALYEVDIYDKNNDTSIHLYEYNAEEDIGDFEFPSDEAYIEIIRNIIDNTK